MAKSIATQLVDTLEQANIKRIYAVAGDSLNEVNDAFRKNNNIQWIHVRHEEVGAIAAAAEAELNGIACCAGSSGPGHVHLINGLYEAQRSNVALLAIASTCASDEFGTGFFQETNTIKLFDDCSGYNQVATTPKQFPRMLQSALQHAYHKKEVAVIGLPGDLASENAVESSTATFLLPSKSIYRPANEELDKLAKILNQDKKITIFCGYGAKDAHDEVVALAEKLKAPVAYSFRGKMGIQYDNPYEIGMTGLLGLPSAYNAMHKTDVLMLLGTDFPYKDFMPTTTEIIQIDNRPERIGRKAKVSMGLAGNVKDSIEALLPMINAKSDTDFLDTYLKEYTSVKQALQTYVKDRGSVHKVSPEYLTELLNKKADEDAIFTMDTGMCCVWGARYIDATGKRELLGSYSHGSMATAMPQAIGAALARPHQQVIALCGDGGLSMLMGDLATIVQYNLPIKIIVYNNRSLGMVKLEMQVHGLPDSETDLINPNFAKVAEAFGIKGIEVTVPEDLDAAIDVALAHDGPVVLSVNTNPDALALPPKIDFSQIKGYAVTMSKLMLSGKSDQVFDIIKSNYKHLKELL